MRHPTSPCDKPLPPDDDQDPESAARRADVAALKAIQPSLDKRSRKSEDGDSVDTEVREAAEGLRVSQCGSEILRSDYVEPGLAAPTPERPVEEEPDLTEKPPAQ